MKSSANISELQLLAASQWGLFSSAQAQNIGVGRPQLSRMTSDGRIENLAFGIYRFTAGETTAFVGIKAAWLSLFPKETAFDRFKNKRPDAIVTGRTAAYINQIGDLQATPYTFIVRDRKQTTRNNIKYLQWEIDEQDIRIIEGLPVTTVERTIADLIRQKEDMSLIDDVVADVINKRISLDGSRLAILLEPLAARNGYPRHNGKAFARDLIRRNSSYQEEINKALELVRSLYVNDEAIQEMSNALKELSMYLSSNYPKEINKALELVRSLYVNDEAIQEMSNALKEPYGHLYANPNAQNDADAFRHPKADCPTASITNKE
jgi:hypothetical protein